MEARVPCVTCVSAMGKGGKRRKCRTVLPTVSGLVCNVQEVLTHCGRHTRTRTNTHTHTHTHGDACTQRGVCNLRGDYVVKNRGVFSTDLESDWCNKKTMEGGQAGVYTLSLSLTHTHTHTHIQTRTHTHTGNVGTWPAALSLLHLCFTTHVTKVKECNLKIPLEVCTYAGCQLSQVSLYNSTSITLLTQPSPLQYPRRPTFLPSCFLKQGRSLPSGVIRRHLSAEKHNYCRRMCWELSSAQRARQREWWRERERGKH